APRRPAPSGGRDHRRGGRLSRDDRRLRGVALPGDSRRVVPARLPAAIADSMKRLAGGLAVLALAGAAFAADENQDIDLIPQAAPPKPQEEAAPERTGSGNDRMFIQNALGFSSVRDDLLVPPPPPSPPRWEEHLFADARLEWALGPHTFVAYSGRLSLTF